MRIKPLLTLLAAGAGILTLFTAPVATAAGPTPTATCYDGQKYWDAGYQDSGHGVSGAQLPGRDDAPDTEVRGEPAYQTTDRCLDINLRMTNLGSYGYVAARVCFYPIAGGRPCNGGKYINDYNWHEIATDVLDRTNFVVEFDYNPYIAGRIAH